MSSLKLIVHWLSALIALLVLSGCAGGNDFVVRNQYVEFTQEQQQAIAVEDAREYRIQEGDILKIAFSYLKELDQDEVVVLPDGSVTLVGVDQIRIAGMTISEADKSVTEAYAREYRDPSLSLIIRKSEGRRVYVLGEVAQPGLHAVPRGGLDIVGAITVAGGFSDDAAKDGTVLVRVNPEGYTVQEIDLSGFHTATYGELAGVNLKNFDVVYVPRSRIGDFGYFSKTVLSGLLNMTRIAADIKYLSGGNIGRVF
jgi:protein involved in polysaccharide export with SLBB domain